MLDNIYFQEVLVVRSTHPELSRQWTTLKCTLVKNSIQYQEVNSKDSIETIELNSIEKIDSWSSSTKSDDHKFVFQIKTRKGITLHSCKSKESRDSWIYKVMKVMAGENPNSPAGSKSNEKKKSKKQLQFEESVSEDESQDESIYSSDSDNESKPQRKRELKRRKSKSKVKKKKINPDSPVLKPSVSKSKLKKKKKKSKPKTKPRSSSVSSQSSDADTIDSDSEETTYFDEEYIQERKEYFEKMTTEDLVKMVSKGLETELNEEKKNIVNEWAKEKKKLLNYLCEAQKLEAIERYKESIEKVDCKVDELLKQ